MSSSNNEIVTKRNLDKLHREMGQVIMSAMEDPLAVEVMLNPDESLWIDRLGSGMEQIGFMNETAALQMLGTIAHMLGTVINADNPKVEGELPGDGSRVEGVIYPIVRKPSFNIRKKASAVFPLSQYLEQGRIRDHDLSILRSAIKERKNLLIVGGTGSGKTTFANAILNEMVALTPNHRVLLLEDTLELQCQMANVVQMRTNDHIKMRDLLRIAMRQRPDRIVVGEVRGGEALDMLKAWNTGHPGGLCTVHANDAAAGLIRLEQLISEVSQSRMRDLIAEAVDIIVFLKRDPSLGPKLTEIVGIKGVDTDLYVFENLREQQN